jgi:hypothetical protein
MAWPAFRSAERLNRSAGGVRVNFEVSAIELRIEPQVSSLSSASIFDQGRCDTSGECVCKPNFHGPNTLGRSRHGIPALNMK